MPGLGPGGFCVSVCCGAWGSKEGRGGMTQKIVWDHTIFSLYEGVGQSVSQAVSQSVTHRDEKTLFS